MKKMILFLLKKEQGPSSAIFFFQIKAQYFKRYFFRALKYRFFLQRFCAKNVIIDFSLI